MAKIKDVNTHRTLIKDLGKNADYLDVWKLQESIFSDIVNKKKSDKVFSNCIIICEHNSVYTIGRSFNEKDIKAYNHVLNFINTPKDIKSFLDNKRCNQLTPCYYINRGGSITYHGPGQIVIYPIIDLASWHKDLHKYLRTLEQIVIDCLQDFNITASRIDGFTGVWSIENKLNRQVLPIKKNEKETIMDGFITQTPSSKKNAEIVLEPPVFSEARKICSIGVRASSWITMHGLALNVNTDMSYFDKIDPCGLKNRKATSMKEILSKDVDIDAVKNNIICYLKNKYAF